MEIYSHPDIPEILSLPGNSNCCDCNSEKPKWTSLNNGVFLCLKCAGIHRSLGVDISVIRSLQIDSWTDKQILYISKGGNFKFKSMLAEYKIDPNSAPEIKYKTLAADYYRKYLKNEVERSVNKEYQPIELVKPSLEEGNKMLEIKKGQANVNNSNVIRNQEQPSEGGFLNVFGSFLNNVKKTAGEVAGKISQEIDHLKIGDKLKEAGGVVVDYAKIGGNYIKDKSEQALNSEFIQGITKTAESGINAVIEKTKILLNNDKKQNLNNNLINNNNEQNDNNQNIMNNNNNELQFSEIVQNNNNNPQNNEENNKKINNNIIDDINNAEDKKNELKEKLENINENNLIEEKKEENNLNNKVEEQKVNQEPENPQNPQN